MNTPINKLRISARLTNICNKHNILTLGELLSLSDFQLSKFRGLGRVTLDEIERLREKVSKPDTKDEYNTIYEIVQKEVKKALSERWYRTHDLLPATKGVTSEKVIVYNGDYLFAHYDRYKGWISDNQQLDNVTHWMKIPKAL